MPQLVQVRLQLFQQRLGLDDRVRRLQMPLGYFDLLLVRGLLGAQVQFLNLIALEP